MQGFEPLQKQEGIERGYCRAEVSQQRHSCFNYICDIAQRFERFDKINTVVARVRTGNGGNLPFVQSNLPESTIMPPRDVPWPR